MITSGPESGRSSYYRRPAALVESDDIGAGTRIWAFVHILPGVSIGSGCNIGDPCFVEGGVRIGNDVVLKNGVSLWADVTIEDSAFVGPNAAFTNVQITTGDGTWESVRGSCGRSYRLSVPVRA